MDFDGIFWVDSGWEKSPVITFGSNPSRIPDHGCGLTNPDQKEHDVAWFALPLKKFCVA